MRRTTFLIALVILVAAVSIGYVASVQARATIKGTVTLGPIYPVCIESVPCDRPLSGYTVTVFDATGTFVVASTVTDEQGIYVISILPGTYVMYTRCSQTVSTCGVPITFSVRQYEHVTIDISVDTGIR